jgi:hypothetical protein
MNIWKSSAYIVIEAWRGRLVLATSPQKLTGFNSIALVPERVGNRKGRYLWHRGE